MSIRPDRLPPAVRPGSRIGLAAPASPALTPKDIDAGLAALHARDLAVETLGGLDAAPDGYLAATDAVRAQTFNALMARDDLDAIFCLRGGYGVLRILDRIDFEAAAKHPKLVVGYSDITALHFALWTKARLPGLSGPMVAPDWPKLDPASEAQFWAVAGGASPIEIVAPDGETLTPLQDGEAEGTLLGGNLTMIASLLGTPYWPDMTGAILFVEEVGESPYQVDRLFARLRLAGVLGQLGGLVLGGFTHADPPKNRPSLSLDAVLAHYAGFVEGPVVTDLVYGHFPTKSTLPVGVRARLSAQDGAASLTLLDPVAR